MIKLLVTKAGIFSVCGYVWLPMVFNVHVSIVSSDTAYKLGSVSCVS